MKQKISSSNTTLPKYIHSPAIHKTREDVRVTIHVPRTVAATLKQQKINKIYDILNPKISQ